MGRPTVAYAGALMLAGLLLAAVRTPSAGAVDGVPDAPAPAGDVELPPELREIVTANTASLARLRSASATIDLSVRSRVQAKEIVYDDVVSVWYDGGNVREDHSAKPGSRVDLRTAAVPAAGGRFVAGPPPEFRQVLTTEEVMSYRPGGAAMSIVPGDADNPYGERVKLLHKYTAVQQGRTLEKQVLKSWGEGFHPTVKWAELDGAECNLLTWDFAEARMAMKVWVAPAQGSMIRKVQQFYKGELTGEWTATLRDYGDGVFWVERIEEKDWHEDRPEPATHLTATVRELKPNVPVEAERFTIAGMGVPAGTQVQDRRRGVEYRVK
jgi:hypothetical protein